MKNIITTLVLALISTSFLFSQVTQKQEPAWIDSVDYYQDEIDEDEVMEGSMLLLYDNQVHIPKQEAYTRLTTKIIDNIGVQNASSITIDYDPSYQTFVIHKVNIIRNGEVLNKLDVNNFQVMRREPNAEIFLYDGSMSAVMHITDVRTDDIIDYSFSIKGFNPIHNNKFSTSFYLNDIVPVGKVHANILSNNHLEIKSFNTDIEPEITRKGNLQQYKWLSTNTEKLDYEENTPEWKLIYETVFVSEYKSWDEVVDWGIKLFKTKTPISKPLQDKIDEINTANKTHGEKIKATLNFVQNEIRYLGLEQGIGSYKPFPPNTVYERRFGDCKDKSFLMATMLNKMGITCYPMLVNTTLKHTIKEVLPSPKFFDHCVVKVIDGAKNEFWYDPTISNQGGEYNTTYFPNYEYGLVLKPENFEFDYIQSFFDNRVDTIEEFTLEGIGKGANLKVTTSYYESEADNMRNYFKSNSLNSIKKELEAFYSSYYYNVNSVVPPSYNDDIKENVFTLTEEYQLDSLWKPMLEKKDHVAVTFIPTTLVNLIYIPTKNTRKTELAMYYPVSKSHRIRIKIPDQWPIEKETVDIISSGFYYELDITYNRKQRLIDIYHYYKTQKSYIEPSEYTEYINDVNRLDQSAGYYLYAPTNSTGAINSAGTIVSSVKTIFKFFIVLAVIIGIVLFIIWQNKKNKKTV